MFIDEDNWRSWNLIDMLIKFERQQMCGFIFLDYLCYGKGQLLRTRQNGRQI